MYLVRPQICAERYFETVSGRHLRQSLHSLIFASADIQMMVARSDWRLDFVEDRPFRQDGVLLIQPAIKPTPRQNQHLLHRIHITTTAPRPLEAQQTCHLHIIHNEFCRRYAGNDFLAQTMLLLEIGMGLNSRDFHSSEAQRAATDLEVEKGFAEAVCIFGLPFQVHWFETMLQGVVSPPLLTQITSSPLIYERLIFSCTILCNVLQNHNVYCTGGQNAGWIKHMRFMVDWHVARFHGQVHGFATFYYRCQ